MSQSPTAGGVEPLPADALTDELAQLLGPRVERLGYLGGFFTHAAHQPEALAAFIRFTKALKSAVPPRLTEVVALTVASRLNNTYEQHQHEQLCLRLGFTVDWVRDVLALRPDETVSLKPVERAVQQLVIQMLDAHGRGAAGRLEHVVQHVGQEEAVGICLLVSRYIAHAVFANTMQLVPPVPSIFEGASDG